MQCMTCRADIPPQWVNAIQRNECPGCGGPIMDDSSKELLTELKEAMTKMPNDPEGLAGWILSNYSLTKVGTGEPVGFHRKPTSSTKLNKGTGRKLKIAENPVQQFLQRTGVAKSLDERKNYKSIVNQINTGEIDESMYGDENDSAIEASEDFNSEIEEDTEESNEVDDNEEEYSSAYEEAEVNRRQMQTAVKSRKNQLKNSLLVPAGNGMSTRPVSPHEVEDVMNTLSKKTGDLSSNPALNAARMKRVQAQEDVASGVMKPGSFRRG